MMYVYTIITFCFVHTCELVVNNTTLYMTYLMQRRPITVIPFKSHAMQFVSVKTRLLLGGMRWDDALVRTTREKSAAARSMKKHRSFSTNASPPPSPLIPLLIMCIFFRSSPSSLIIIFSFVPGKICSDVRFRLWGCVNVLVAVQVGVRVAEYKDKLHFTLFNFRFVEVSCIWRCTFVCI